MDNISKRTFTQVCADIFKYILIFIPAVADILGIVSWVCPDLQSLIASQASSSTLIAIFVFANIVLLASIFFILNDAATKRVDKATEFIDGYDKLLEDYAGYLADLDSDFDNIQTENDLYKNVATSLKTIVDKTRNIISEVTDSKMRVCIKSFPKRYDESDLDSMELMTLCRSDKTVWESMIERMDWVKVTENTDFKLIMMQSTTYPYFAFNGLENFEQTTQIPYENSTYRWDKRYKATIVYPISKKVATKRGKDVYNVLGFLCVDTLSEKAFTAVTGPMCIKFVSSLTHILYIFLDKCISCRERIENAKSQNEKECVGVGQ